MLCALLVRKLLGDPLLAHLSSKASDWSPPAWLVTLNKDVVRQPKPMLRGWGVIHLSFSQEEGLGGSDDPSVLSQTDTRGPGLCPCICQSVVMNQPWEGHHLGT